MRASRLYDGRPVEDSRFAVAVHREGNYTVEVVDSDGRSGAYRVGPADFESAGPVPGTVETGKGSLTQELARRLADLLDLVRTLDDGSDDDRTPTPTEAEDTPTPVREEDTRATEDEQIEKTPVPDEEQTGDTHTDGYNYVKIFDPP